MSSVLGYACVVIAVICMGSSFVPLKGIRIGDGMFFSFCMCNAIFMTSIPVLIIRGFPPVHGLAFFGGFLWCTGNMLCPLAVKFIGMGLGLILWGCTSMLFGWASGTFGLFGLTKQPVNNMVLNCVGVAISIVGFFIYMQVRTVDTSVDAKRFSDRKAQQEYRKNILSSLQTTPTEGINTLYDETDSPMQAEEAPRPSFMAHDERRSSVTFKDVVADFEPERPSVLFRDSEMERPSVAMQSIPEAEEVDEYNPFMRTERLMSGTSNLSTASTRSRTIGDDWSPNRKRMVGMSCAIVAGVFFGCSFDPSQYVIDHRYDGDDNSLNYVFSQFTGVLMTSWFYTIVYSTYHFYKSTKPYFNAESVLPATLAGLIRGVALIAWFTANGELGFPITFPIITAGPGMIGALWGIFVFKEITGKRNYMILGVAMSVTIMAMAIIASSK